MRHSPMYGFIYGEDLGQWVAEVTGDPETYRLIATLHTDIADDRGQDTMEGCPRQALHRHGLRPREQVRRAEFPHQLREAVHQPAAPEETIALPTRRIWEAPFTSGKSSPRNLRSV